MNINIFEKELEETIRQEIKQKGERKVEEELSIFSLSYDLFHLRLKRKFFLKEQNFKSHLISRMKKKIACLKKMEAIKREQKN